MGRNAAAAAALICFCVIPASAQSRGMAASHSMGARPAVSVHSIPVRSIPVPVRTRRVIPTNQNGIVNPVFTAGFFPGGTIQDLFGFPVPGLGFDFVNFAAVNGNLGVRALIDPVTQQEIALALRLQGAGLVASPFFFSPFGGSPIVVESPASVAPQTDPPAQPPIIVVAPPAPQTAAPAQPAVQDQPLPDPGEFVLVQRDGRLLFAVAFTNDPGRVVYITKEGLRRSIALDQLDVDATLRMNEERGTSIQIPKA
jgi:hypothetical protein